METILLRLPSKELRDSFMTRLRHKDLGFEYSTTDSTTIKVRPQDLELFPEYKQYILKADSSFTINWSPVQNGIFPFCQLNEIGLLTEVQNFGITKQLITISTADGSSINQELAFEIGALVHSYTKLRY